MFHLHSEILSALHDPMMREKNLKIIVCQMFFCSSSNTVLSFRVICQRSDVMVTKYGLPSDFQMIIRVTMDPPQLKAEALTSITCPSSCNFCCLPFCSLFCHLHWLHQFCEVFLQPVHVQQSDPEFTDNIMKPLSGNRRMWSCEVFVYL